VIPAWVASETVRMRRSMRYSRTSALVGMLGTAVTPYLQHRLEVRVGEGTDAALGDDDIAALAAQTGTVLATLPRGRWVVR
jgi:hypothetical protein